MNSVTDDDPAILFLRQRLNAARFSIQDSDIEGSWIVDLPGTWGELHKTFSKSMRRKTKDAAKRLDSETTTIN